MTTAHNNGTGNQGKAETMTTPPQRLSTRRLTSICTYDPSDCTASGWEITLYSDGHLAAEFSTRWQGETSGERFVTAPGRMTTNPSDEQAHVAMLAEAERLDTALNRISWDTDNRRSIQGWRPTRRGYVVR